MGPLILYSSYQEGEFLPEYIRYALLQLSPLGEVKFLTNSRRLGAAELKFLEENNIELFLTENKGYDFGMWKRYLEANPLKLEQKRILLLNDSIVYYKQCFKTFIEKSEESLADIVGLLENSSETPHLQSFFLYLKEKAIPVFAKHLFETPLAESFEETIKNFEVQLSQKFKEASLKTEDLFQTKGDPILSYPELIAQNGGFVKKRLLERRFSFDMQRHFWLNGKASVLYLNYRKYITKWGEKDSAFQESYFPNYSKSMPFRILERIKGWGYRVLAFFYFRYLKKIRDKFIRKAI